MKNVFTCFIFCYSVTLIYSAQQCNTQTDCTLAPTNSFCNPQGFCQCQNGYIFNCSTMATPLYSGSSTLNIPPQNTLYYIIGNTTNQNIEYFLSLTDNTQTYMLANYTLDFYTDEGVGRASSQPFGNLLNNGNQLQIDIQMILGNMPGTTIPQQIVMSIENNQTTTGVISASFSFTTTNGSNANNTLLIVAYVGGAFCLCVTLVLMIVIYRKRITQQPRNLSRQPNNVNAVIDISHFDTLMPISHISVQHKREGKVCSVCLQEFQLNAAIRTTVCGHVFHSTCIDQWCIKNLICPMCRTELTTANILILRSQNSKKDNNSSWIKNSIADENSQDEEAKQPQPHSNRLNEPFLQQNDTQRPVIGNEQL